MKYYSLFVSLILLSCITAAQEQNILLIIADDVGVDPIEGYMTEATIKAHMPTLDSLMQQGLTFDNVWTNPICSPTRSAILSGRYGFRTGVYDAVIYNEIPEDELSLHEHIDLLSPNEYTSSIIGKWHLSPNGPGNNNHPSLLGIEHYEGLLAGAVSDYYDWTFTQNGESNPSSDYITTTLTDSAIDWINNQDDNWFCWLAYNAPHSPFHLPPANMHSQGDLPADQGSIDANPLPYYIAMIESLDFELKRLLASIPEEELANTTIIWIGDNGTPGGVAQAPYAFNKAKGSLYQGGIHVPMVVAGNAVTRMNEREDALIVSTDIHSTILELTGAELNEYEDSQSFYDLLSEDLDGPRECSYTDAYAANKGFGWAARDERFKYFIWDSVPERFYDLWEDPFENQNLLNGTGELTTEENIAYTKLANLRETLGINDESLAKEKTILFPNPSSNSIQLFFSGNTEREYTIVAANGQLVSTGITKSDESIDISRLMKGIYFLKIEEEYIRFAKI